MTPNAAAYSYRTNYLLVSEFGEYSVGRHYSDDAVEVLAPYMVSRLQNCNGQYDSVEGSILLSICFAEGTPDAPYTCAVTDAPGAIS